jgi:hypothetical protein
LVAATGPLPVSASAQERRLVGDPPADGCLSPGDPNRGHRFGC